MKTLKAENKGWILMNKGKIISLLAVSTLMAGSFATLQINQNQVVMAKKKKTVSAAKSKKNLASAIQTPMTKENYENLENGLIESAQQDAQDTSARLSGNSVDSKTEQQHIKKFNTRTGNLTKISEHNDKEVKTWKSSLTKSDYKMLKKYNKSLNKYIESLQDYASDVESEGAVKNDPNASEQDKNDAQEAINKSQSKFNEAKNKWIQMYDQLSNNAQ